MTESFEARIAKAREHVKSISPEDIEARLASDPKTLLLDVRDEGGRSAGVIPGSTNVSLGTLFFKADQTSPYHDAETFPDLDHPIVCTCTGGGQAAVASGPAQGLRLHQRHHRRRWCQGLGGIRTDDR